MSDDFLKYEINAYKTPGFISCKLTENQLKPIKSEIKQIQSNFDNGVKCNNTLIGHIQKEFDLILCKDHIEQLLLPLVMEYDRHYGILESFNILSKSVPLYLDRTWVNFQKKHEFNPIHNHSGVVSFALWIQIPFLYEDEAKLFPELSDHNNKTSTFEFHYIHSDGKIGHHKIKADKTYENSLVLFPSSMMHSVNPFYTSDDYRISVSGNFKIKI